MGSEEARSGNENGKSSLSSASALVDETERVPKEAVSGMQVSLAPLRGRKLEPIVKLLLEELDLDLDSQHFREAEAATGKTDNSFR